MWSRVCIANCIHSHLLPHEGFAATTNFLFPLFCPQPRWKLSHFVCVCCCAVASVLFRRWSSCVLFPCILWAIEVILLLNGNVKSANNQESRWTKMRSRVYQWDQLCLPCSFSLVTYCEDEAELFFFHKEVSSIIVTLRYDVSAWADYLQCQWLNEYAYIIELFYF